MKRPCGSLRSLLVAQPALHELQLRSQLREARTQLALQYLENSLAHDLDGIQGLLKLPFLGWVERWRTGTAIGFRIRWLRRAAEEAGLVLIGDFLLQRHVRCVARQIVFDVAVYEMAVGHLRAAARAIDPLCFAFPRHFAFFAFLC